MYWVVCACAFVGILFFAIFGSNIAMNIYAKVTEKALDKLSPSKKCPTCGGEIKAEARTPPGVDGDMFPETPEIHYPNFCPHCGARGISEEA